jgi:predicted DNA-binding transcriptional regulator YafY
MRADRLLSIVLLLETYGQMKAQELAKRLEVSRRTIQRDMEALSTAGIPLVANRGTGGGWALLEPYRTNMTGLNSDEIMALFLNKPPRVLEDLGVYQASKSAVLKLLAAIPEIARPYAEWIQESFYLDTSGWDRNEEQSNFLPVLQEAICEQRQIRLTYRRYHEGIVEYLVDPLGLVAKGNRWHLVAQHESEIRPYRITQIVDAQLTGDSFNRPLDFSLADYWEESGNAFVVADSPPYPALVRVAPEAMPRLPGCGVCIEAVDPPDADGWRRAAILLENEAEACTYVLGFGLSIVVLEPPELRQRVMQISQGMTALYSGALQPESV